MNLLRATENHTVTTGRGRFHRGRVYTVRPPTVREALAVIYAASEDDVDTVRDVARRWLPRGLYRELFPAGVWKLIYGEMPPEAALGFVTRIIAVADPTVEEDEGKRQKKKHEEGEEALTPEEAMFRFLHTPWATLVAEYSHFFSTPVEAVMDAPWPLFQLMLGAAQAMRARSILDTLQAKGLQYAESADRDRSFRELQERAGYSEVLSPAEQLRRQKETFRRLKSAARPIHP